MNDKRPYVSATSNRLTEAIAALNLARHALPDGAAAVIDIEVALDAATRARGLVQAEGR